MKNTRRSSLLANPTRLIKVILGCIIFSQIFASVHGQHARAYLSSQSIKDNQVLKYFFEITGKPGNYPNPVFPELDGFKESGVTYSAASGLNGPKSIFTKTYIPQKTGIFTIPAFHYEGGGVSYTTPEFVIKVSASGSRSQQAQSDQRAFSGVPVTAHRPTQFPGSMGLDFFLSMNLDKAECFVGEQVHAEVLLYVAARDEGKVVFNGQQITALQHRMNNDGFWEEIFNSSKMPTRPIDLNNKRYIAYTLYESVLYPLKAGTYSFDDIYMEVDKLMHARYGEAVWEKREVFAGAKSLKVIALPGKGPEDTYPIGEFAITGDLSEERVKTGHPVELRIKISGIGNMAFLDPPKIRMDGSIQVFEPNPEYVINKEGGLISGEKVFSYTLVPTVKGVYEIGPIEYPYYDPVEDRFNKLELKGLRMMVEGKDMTDLAVGSATLDGFYKEALGEEHSSLGQDSSSGMLVFFVFASILIGAGGFIGFQSFRKKA